MRELNKSNISLIYPPIVILPWWSQHRDKEGGRLPQQTLENSSVKRNTRIKYKILICRFLFIYLGQRTAGKRTVNRWSIWYVNGSTTVKCPCSKRSFLTAGQGINESCHRLRRVVIQLSTLHRKINKYYNCTKHSLYSLNSPFNYFRKLCDLLEYM